jgi:hypothetical protein
MRIYADHIRLYVVMGLLVLPVSRNSLWSHVFGVSWESMLIYHKYLGGTFIFIILAHMFSWWVVFDQVRLMVWSLLVCFKPTLTFLACLTDL